MNLRKVDELLTGRTVGVGLGLHLPGGYIFLGELQGWYDGWIIQDLAGAVVARLTCSKIT
jgi:hypothetical protein